MRRGSARIDRRRANPRGRLVLPVLVALALGLAAVGCGADAAEVISEAAPTAGSSEPGPDPLGMTLRAAADGSALLFDDGEALHVLDPATASERFVAVGAVASGDGSSVVSAAPSGAQTEVVVRSALDGSLRWTTTVAGPLEVVGASREGETVVLVDPSAPGGTTSFVVVRFAFASDPVLGDVRTMLPPTITAAPTPSSQRYDLPGELEYDGIGDATSTVFVLQRSATDPDAYKVRALDLWEGGVSDMSDREKFTPEGEMYGRYRSALVVPERGEVATLYTIDGGGGDGAAFVHLLNTRGAYADCLDLPAPLGRGVPSTLAVGAIPPGDPLLVFDSEVGIVASFDPDVLGSVSTFATTEPALAAGHPAAVAADLGHVYLAGGDEVVAHDLLGTVTGTWSAGGQVTALAVVPGSGWIAAIVDGAVRLFEPDGRPVRDGLRPTSTPPPIPPPPFVDAVPSSAPTSSEPVAPMPGSTPGTPVR